jgi:uncharacterized protein
MRAFVLSLGLALAFGAGVVALPAPALAAEAPIPPPPARYMTDTVGFVSPAARDALDARLEAYQRATGHQVVVWIGDSLDGTDLADWSVRTFEKWKPGRKGQDDGVAMFVLAGDRKIDIEVGYGLEGQLTDAKARRIIDGMGEKLQAGDRDGALASGVESIFAAIDGQPFPGSAGTQTFTSSDRPQPRPLGLGQKIFFGLLAVGFVILFITNPRMAMLLLWSIMGRGGGGGGGFGGGGGGFEGGGGRSGGGGARGGW